MYRVWSIQNGCFEVCHHETRFGPTPITAKLSKKQARALADPLSATASCLAFSLPLRVGEGDDERILVMHEGATRVARL